MRPQLHAQAQPRVPFKPPSLCAHVCCRNPDLPIDPETGEPIESEATNDVSDLFARLHAWALAHNPLQASKYKAGFDMLSLCLYLRLWAHSQF